MIYLTSDLPGMYSVLHAIEHDFSHKSCYFVVYVHFPIQTQGKQQPTGGRGAPPVGARRRRAFVVFLVLVRGSARTLRNNAIAVKSRVLLYTIQNTYQVDLKYITWCSILCNIYYIIYCILHTGYYVLY